MKMAVRRKTGCSLRQVSRKFCSKYFSPNHDGINDRFMLSFAEGIHRIRSLRIYNRWGGLVYEGRNMDKSDADGGWDGRFKDRDAAPGTYVYYAELETRGGKTMVIKGGLTLIR